MKIVNKKTSRCFLLITFILALIFSAIKPHDYFTWFLEVCPAIVGLILLLLTYRRFEFTDLAYLLIWLHALVLLVGGHYTYAQVPAFNWLRDTFHLGRNYYDRVGHFMQGFVPAIIAREILIRRSPVKQGGWLYFYAFCICGSITALYELFEWAVALATGTAADAFLGTQGDVWDTQWDMFLAFVGANMALLLLSKIHDRSLEQVTLND
jgi:putative membrane protein